MRRQNDLIRLLGITDFDWTAKVIMRFHPLFVLLKNTHSSIQLTLPTDVMSPNYVCMHVTGDRIKRVRE